MKIKSIVLKDVSNNETLNIEFGQLNLIVGPRGGGKSTLFDLLAAAQINKTSKETLKFLNERFIKPEKIIFENGEEKFFSTLVPTPSKEILEDGFSPNHNIISQKDMSKSGLDSTENILKERKKLVEQFSAKFLSDSAMMKEKFKDLDQFVKFSSDFGLKAQSSINWNTLFKIVDTKSEKSFVTSLVYQPNLKIRDIRTSIDDLRSIKDLYESFLNSQSKQISNLEFSPVDFSEGFLKNAQSWIEFDKKIFEERIKALDTEIFRLRKHIMFIEKFELVLKAKNDEEKKKDFSNKGTEGFIASANSFFKETASLLSGASRVFANLENAEISLDINMDLKSSDGLLSYKNLGINLSENPDDIFSLLKMYLYTPSGAKNDYREWLKTTLEKGMQSNGQTKLENEITRKIIDSTKVFADNKDYERMSPGEKSIFGIKYKLIHATEDVIFIDQPEDNLDNHSITNEILPLLIEKKKEGKQIFVVTHNANIGILTNPEKVIVANLASENFKDIYINTTPNGISENPKAYYLEGGYERLKERFILLDKEENL